MHLQRVLNFLFIITLCFVLLASYCYQFIKGEAPCPLCHLQRLSMIGIAIGLLLNLRFGIKSEHYGLAILSAVCGYCISLRQICLHICPQFTTFGQPVLGFNLYVWACIVFTCSIFSCAVLLMLAGFLKIPDEKPHWGLLEKTAFGLVAALILSNILTSFLQCGFTYC